MLVEAILSFAVYLLKQVTDAGEFAASCPFNHQARRLIVHVGISPLAPVLRWLVCWLVSRRAIRFMTARPTECRRFMTRRVAGHS